MARYRLDALVRVKAHEKERAEAALAKALEACKRARKQEEELVRQKKAIIERWLAMREEMGMRMDLGGSVFDGTIYVNYLRKLKEEEEAKAAEIAAQREVVATCEAAVVSRRRDYIEAAKELQVMEKHKALWRKKVLAELTRREEREFDELANTITQLKRWRGEGAEVAKALGR